MYHDARAEAQKSYEFPQCNSSSRLGYDVSFSNQKQTAAGHVGMGHTGTHIHFRGADLDRSCNKKLPYVTNPPAKCNIDKCYSNFLNSSAEVAFEVKNKAPPIFDKRNGMTQGSSTFVQRPSNPQFHSGAITNIPTALHTNSSESLVPVLSQMAKATGSEKDVLENYQAQNANSRISDVGINFEDYIVQINCGRKASEKKRCSRGEDESTESSSQNVASDTVAENIQSQRNVLIKLDGRNKDALPIVSKPQLVLQGNRYLSDFGGYGGDAHFVPVRNAVSSDAMSQERKEERHAIFSNADCSKYDTFKMTMAEVSVSKRVQFQPIKSNAAHESDANQIFPNRKCGSFNKYFSSTDVNSNIKTTQERHVRMPAAPTVSISSIATPKVSSPPHSPSSLLLRGHRRRSSSSSSSCSSSSDSSSETSSSSSSETSTTSHSSSDSDSETAENSDCGGTAESAYKQFPSAKRPERKRNGKSSGVLENNVGAVAPIKMFLKSTTAKVFEAEMLSKADDPKRSQRNNTLSVKTGLETSEKNLETSEKNLETSEKNLETSEKNCSPEPLPPGVSNVSAERPLTGRRSEDSRVLERPRSKEKKNEFCRSPSKSRKRSRSRSHSPRSRVADSRRRSRSRTRRSRSRERGRTPRRSNERERRRSRSSRRSDRQDHHRRSRYSEWRSRQGRYDRHRESGNHDKRSDRLSRRRDLSRNVKVDPFGLLLPVPNESMPAGYCFVEFPDAEAAGNALLKLNGKGIPGSKPHKLFKLNHASFGREHLQIPEYSLYVGELTPDVDDLALYNTFSKRYKSIRAAKVVLDETGKNKGYGFVRFTSQDEQQLALIEMQYFNGLGQRPIRVSLAVPKMSKRAAGNNAIGPAHPHQGSYSHVPPPPGPEVYSQYNYYHHTPQQYHGHHPQYASSQYWSGEYSTQYYAYAPGADYSADPSQQYPQTGADQNYDPEDEALEDPDLEIDVEKANKEFMERSEEFYVALEGSRWHPLDSVFSEIVPSSPKT